MSTLDPALPSRWHPSQGGAAEEQRYPADSAPAAIRTAASTPASSSDVLADACVLIVDDQLANAASLERLLRSGGVTRTHTVTDPREAAARCLVVDADLVLLDLHMPGMDGYQVLAQLRGTLPEGEFLPVLIFTGDNTDEARNRALQAGANDFLTKPLDRVEILLRVRNLLTTRFLHAELRQHNAMLRADLDACMQDDRLAVEIDAATHRRIDAALAPGALRPVFQPIVDLHSDTTVGMEALARFECEPRRTPDVWFQEAADVGRGAALELAAARAAISNLDRLPPHSFLAINVSPATAILPELTDLLERFDTSRLVLELTEHARIDDYAPLVAAADRLRASGVRIAVDDTGTGYAGLGHLLQLRPDIIKLDLTLVRNIDTDPARRALAAALVPFAAEIGSEVIAEGIETAGELQALRQLGICWGQGYHLGRPAALTAAVRSHVA